MIGLLANAVDPWDWTLWETPSLLVQVHVTVAPTATVSTAGFAVLLWALMNTIRPLLPTVTDPTGESYSDRKSTRLNSSHVRISYAVFCLKKKKNHGHRCQQFEHYAGRDLSSC